ncbi:MAG: hypothetical protein C4K48_08965 [Candidatus Thorarchaeota archaeon]|nr:MAG: hypothetical protein C4K48_08965 [Candidatus Thorarchaeota archaeon]
MAVGIVMLAIGGYSFTMSMLMITNMTLPFDWIIWAVFLAIGIILVSLGPSIIAWSFVSKHQAANELAQWQVVQLPRICPECNHSLEIHSLEWIGPEEARCPFCSSQVQIRKSVV